MITEAEQKYIALCEQVNERALKVMAAAHNGGAERAATMALSLCDFVCDAKQAVLIQHERTSPGAYDLAALRVDASEPSNSETGFEDRG